MKLVKGYSSTDESLERLELRLAELSFRVRPEVCCSDLEGFKVVRT